MARKSAAAGSKPSRSPSRTREPPSMPAAVTQTPSTSSKSVSKPKSKAAPSSTVDTLQSLVDNYKEETPQRIRLLDTFLVFLVAVGVLQFAYCVIGGNYPFNAFLAGFAATVGQFVLTVSLRMQSVAINRKEFKEVSPERAFADFILGSLLLHVFCINFIN